MSYAYAREVSPVALHHGYLSPPISSHQEEEEDRPLRHSDSMSTLRTISSASSASPASCLAPCQLMPCRLP
jgi:hypothetical protein